MRSVTLTDKFWYSSGGAGFRFVQGYLAETLRAFNDQAVRRGKAVQMKHQIRVLAATILMLTGVISAMAIEEAPYKVVKETGIYELREYAPHVLAETIVVKLVNLPYR
jgi:hypothetical protein